MIIELTLKLDVDEKEWARAYGLDIADVKEDVLFHVPNVLPRVLDSLPSTKLLTDE